MQIIMSEGVFLAITGAGVVAGWMLSKNPSILDQRANILFSMLALALVWINAQTFFENEAQLGEYASFVPIATATGGLGFVGGNIIGIALCQVISWAMGWHIEEK